jgi:type II secretory pathway pseudopilin PulG
MVRPITAGKAYSHAPCGFVQLGFTYLAVLLLVFILLLSLGVASEHIATIKKREREAELIFIGGQYRDAIASYYYSSGGNKQLPLTLDSMILDSRSLTVLRHLRKKYEDPITNSDEWGLLKTPQGGITGVYSLSNEEVLSTVNNPSLWTNTSLGENSIKLMPAVYSNWKFIFKPDNQDESSISTNSINDGNEDEKTSDIELEYDDH